MSCGLPQFPPPPPEPFIEERWVQTNFELVPVYLSGSFPTFIQYLQNQFFKSLAIVTILSPF